MTRILQTNIDPKVCDFAYREYVNSGTFRMGKEPRETYDFIVGRIQKANYGLEEYRQVQQWSAKFAGTIPENYHAPYESPNDTFEEIEAKKEIFPKATDYFAAFNTGRQFGIVTSYMKPSGAWAPPIWITGESLLDVVTDVPVG